MPSTISRASSGALERRLDHQRYVVSLGITPKTLSDVVDEFYIRIRAHRSLGPVFEEQIGDDWTDHLNKMKSFWISVALNAGSYSGKPVVTHKALKNVNANHFDEWLSLFYETVSDVIGSNDAVAFLNERAEKMAVNFKRAMGLVQPSNPEQSTQRPNS